MVGKATQEPEARATRPSGRGRNGRKTAKGMRVLRVRVPREGGVSPSYLALSYLALVVAYPNHPIRSEEDLDEAIAVIDKLLSRRKPLDPQEQEYLDSLSHEVERYEAEAHPMPAVSDAALLRHLIEAREGTLSEVAAATGIALSTLSSVLSGKRSLNRKHIEKLAPYFGVEPGVFLG
jgi:HTH-type transcriptional regulator/antitoxin HigA